tara:strand:+ start:733 stop:918 length:186 start_codon:yes stop_codon:yes gene_type:complete
MKMDDINLGVAIGLNATWTLGGFLLCVMVGINPVHYTIFIGWLCVGLFVLYILTPEKKEEE